MAYTTAGGTKKKVCYYYDGTGHPDCLNGQPEIETSGQANVSRLARRCLAGSEWMVLKLATELALTSVTLRVNSLKEIR